MGWSPYHYCGNNPVMSLDPNGLAAWEVKREWSKNDEEGYQKWYSENSKNFVGTRAECAKLQFMMRAAYAEENGLPLVFYTSSGKKIDAQSDDFNKLDDFVKKGIGKLTSKDMAANTYEISADDMKSGDMVKLEMTSESTGAVFKHVVGYVEVGDKPKIIYGNLRSDGSAGTVKINNGGWVDESRVRSQSGSTAYKNRRDHTSPNTVLRFYLGAK